VKVAPRTTPLVTASTSVAMDSTSLEPITSYQRLTRAPSFVRAALRPLLLSHE